MNRSSPGLLISKSIDGFLKFKTAEGLSLRTITSYEFTLNHWLRHIGDRSVSDIQASDLTGYMAWLRTELFSGIANRREKKVRHAPAERQPRSGDHPDPFRHRALGCKVEYFLSE